MRLRTLYVPVPIHGQIHTGSRGSLSAPAATRTPCAFRASQIPKRCRTTSRSFRKIEFPLRHKRTRTRTARSAARPADRSPLGVLRWSSRGSFGAIYNFQRLLVLNEAAITVAHCLCHLAVAFRRAGSLPRPVMALRLQGLGSPTKCTIALLFASKSPYCILKPRGRLACEWKTVLSMLWSVSLLSHALIILDGVCPGP